MAALRNRGNQANKQEDKDDDIEQDVLDNEFEQDEDIISVLSKGQKKEEELWDDNDRVAPDVKVAGKLHDTRVKKLRKSVIEIGVRMVVHMVLLAVFLAIHVHSIEQFKKCPEPTRTKLFYGGVPFGGLWKYLTHICMWVTGVYFFLAFFTDIMPLSLAKSWFRQFSDWFFTTLTWPLAWIVCILFWIFFLTDATLIRGNTDYSVCYPDTLNHGLHTVPAIAVLIECVMVYHNYPSHLMACFTVLMGLSSYGIWVLVIFSVTKTFPYPFLAFFTPVTYMIGMFGFAVIGIIIYYVGRIIASLIWKERFDTLHLMEYQDYDELD